MRSLDGLRTVRDLLGTYFDLVASHGELESWNPRVAPQDIPQGVRLEPIARVLGVVEKE